jgi:hypothetical protein
MKNLVPFEEVDELEKLLADAAALDEVETPSLVLSKGGFLTFHNWVYDEAVGKGEYVDVDITNDWLHKRDKDIVLAPGVTLNDVFLFVSRDAEIWDIILTNCYVKKFVETWKKIDQASIKFTHEYDPEAIEYLEVYWAPDLFTWAGKTKISGVSRADLHGKGFVLQDDKYEDEEKTYKLYSKGTRIQWGVDFTPLIDLLGLPIQLDTQFKIQQEWQKYMKLDEIATLLDAHRDYSLQEVLEGIFWELSFYGGEVEKLEKRDEVMAIKDSIDFKNLSIEP